MIVAWAVIAAATWLLWRRQPSASVPLQAWRSADSLGLAVILALTLAIATPPLARVGEADAIGEHRYRAYFTADFVWHTALAAELSKFTMPPRNPYLASQTIHYYWAYFLLPATVSTLAPGPLGDLERCLKVNALTTGLVLMSMVFLAAWVAVGQAFAVAIAVALALIAASAEGTYELVRLWSRGQPFVALRDINIDAITAWHFRGLRLDGLPRCLWYVPQHSMSYALGLIALTAASAVGSAGTLGVILLCGVAIGGATMLNPFVGGLFAVAWAGAIALDALKRPRAIVVVARHAIAAVPVVLALMWCFAAHMVDGAGDSLAFGFWGPPAYSTVTVLLLSLGPVPDSRCARPHCQDPRLVLSPSAVGSAGWDLARRDAPRSAARRHGVGTLPCRADAARRHPGTHRPRPGGGSASRLESRSSYCLRPRTRDRRPDHDHRCEERPGRRRSRCRARVSLDARAPSGRGAGSALDSNDDAAECAGADGTDGSRSRHRARWLGRTLESDSQLRRASNGRRAADLVDAGSRVCRKDVPRQNRLSIHECARGMDHRPSPPHRVPLRRCAGSADATKARRSSTARPSSSRRCSKPATLASTPSDSVSHFEIGRTS